MGLFVYVGGKPRVEMKPTARKMEIKKSRENGLRKWSG